MNDFFSTSVPARDGGAVVGSAEDGRSANVDAALGVDAERIAALALHQRLTLFSAGQRDQRVAAVIRAALRRATHYVRTPHHVVLPSSDSIVRLIPSHWYCFFGG